MTFSVFSESAAVQASRAWISSFEGLSPRERMISSASASSASKTNSQIARWKLSAPPWVDCLGFGLIVGFHLSEDAFADRVIVLFCEIQGFLNLFTFLPG